MLSNVSKKLACLMFAGVMLGVAVAEAGTIPTNNVPLYTYATKKIYCYNSPGGAQKGYIDPGDDITITKVQSNGWVYGNYPTARGRVSRWFKASDLLADRAANYTRYAPKATTTVYRDNSYRSSMGSVNNNETITVVGGSGNSRQIIYKLSNGKGYKMGWFPYWDAWTYEQAFGPKKPTPTPQPVVVDNNVKSRIYNLYQSGYNTADKGNCKEFARDVFNKLFGAYVGSTSSNNMDINGCSNGRKHRAAIDGNYSGRYRTNIPVSQSYRDKVKSAFQSAKPGYFVQMGRRDKYNSTRTAASPHSAIIYYVDSNRIYFYEANWTKNKITISHSMTFDQFAATFLGFSIYAPNNYR